MAPDFIPAARFRFLTPRYDRLCSLVGLGRRLRRFELSLIEGPAPQSVLDVGCGTGELLAGIAARFPGAAVTGLDADPDALAIAARKLEGRRLTARLVPGRAESLPFRDASFDLVLSSLMLHHLPPASKLEALREWRRVLSPTGALLLVDFGRARSWLARAATWPLRPFEHVADNLRGRIPWMLEQTGFAHEEVGKYGAVVIAIRAMGSTGISMGGMGGGMMSMMQANAGTTGLATAMTTFVGSSMSKSGVQMSDVQTLVNKLSTSTGTIQ